MILKSCAKLDRTLLSAQGKVSRNAPCPCGSGTKYNQCCLRKDVDWRDADGNLFKSMPISDEMLWRSDERHQLFIAEH
ncbi:MAG: SEC-C domain-containing protein [Planctomycetes bacterium]|nr:SEC-C domain-containing protein [Planctomycetota bacterium]